MYKESIIETLKEIINYLETEKIERTYLPRFNYYADKLLKLKKNREYHKKISKS